MLSRVSSLRFLAANVSKLATTRRTTPPAFNLLLHTSTAWNDEPKYWNNIKDRFKSSRIEEPENYEDNFFFYEPPDPDDASGEPERRVAVVLAGCGHFDGSVPLEVMSLLLHLKTRPVGVRLFGPDIWDHRNRLLEINHINRTRKRVMIHPVARIMDMLQENRIYGWYNLLQEDIIRDYDGVFIPGGEVLLKHPFNMNLLRAIYLVNRLEIPLATISNAGVLAAWAISGVRITIGSEDNRGQRLYDNAAGFVQRFGGQMQNEGALGVAHDENHNVFSTPGYLDHLASYFDIHCGIGRLVDLALANRPQRVAQN